MKKSLVSLVAMGSLFMAGSAMATEGDWSKVLPVVEKQCAACHGNDKAEYEGWLKSGSLQKHLNVNDKEHYEYLGSNDQERAANLAIFKAWGGAGWNK